MNLVRDRRTSVLATVTAIIVAVAGVLIFTRTGLQPPVGPTGLA